MTVRKLTQLQKNTIVTMFTDGVRNKLACALMYGVSVRTIERVLSEAVPKPVVDNSQYAQVMALLYKHKMTVEQLEELLEGQKVVMDPKPKVKVVFQTKRTKKSPKEHNGKQQTISFDKYTKIL